MLNHPNPPKKSFKISNKIHYLPKIRKREKKTKKPRSLSKIPKSSKETKQNKTPETRSVGEKEGGKEAPKKKTHSSTKLPAEEKEKGHRCSN